MKVNWFGISGKLYEMDLCDFRRPLNQLAGVYIFCKPAIAQGRWADIYIGETDNLNEHLYVNLANHHRWDSIRREGATNVCALPVSGPRWMRLEIETDLRAALRSPCNLQ